MGVEPTFSAWEADVLPLNYTRIWYYFFIHTPNYQAFNLLTYIDYTSNNR